MDNIAPFLNPEQDAFYLMGEERVQKRFVHNMLAETDMTVERIADLIELPVAFVEQVRAEMIDNK